MARAIKNIEASVRTRLLDVARRKKQNFNLVLTRYAIERLLYRIAESHHAERFVLKGAMLMMTWFDDPVRSTHDLDLLSHGDPVPQSILADFKDMLRVEHEDGVRFKVDLTSMERIREGNEFGGVRIRTEAEISSASIPIKIDVGSGDATEPGVGLLNYPVILNMPAPRLRGYAPEPLLLKSSKQSSCWGTRTAV